MYILFVVKLNVWHLFYNFLKISVTDNEFLMIQYMQNLILQPQDKF